jgi:predicted DNA helicase
VVLDEATQGVEPASWIPIARGQKLVMAGDHCQLPPTVYSNRQGRQSLRFTLFERFHETLPETSRIRLSAQYRMNESIMKFPSREFYAGELEAHESVRDHVLAGWDGVGENEETRQPLVFLDTAGLGYEEKVEPGTSSRFNPSEARLVEAEFRRLVESGMSPEKIGIVSPYSAQVKLLTRAMVGEEDDRRGVPEIDSVDAFQGREMEAVIVSLVRSNLSGELGFLADTRRMNVAMTRARRKLVLIGDSATLSAIPFYERFIRHAETEGAYRSAWEWAE